MPALLCVVGVPETVSKTRGYRKMLFEVCTKMQCLSIGVATTWPSQLQSMAFCNGNLQVLSVVYVAILGFS